MAGEAATATLDELCDLIVDCPHSTPVWTSSGEIVLRNQNIRGGKLDLTNPSYTDAAHYLDRTRRAMPTPGDLVITREAPMGEVCQIPKGLRCCLGQRMVLLRPSKSKVDGRFLLYAIQSKSVQDQIRWAEGTGSTVSNLRIPDLKKLEIPSPEILEQRAIAHILGTLDDKIELNRRRNQTLEAMARALFKDWFVDFGPTRAKMDGAEPYLPADLWQLFPDRLDDEGKPEGWACSTIGEEVTVCGGSTPSTKEAAYWEGGANCWATPKDLSPLTTPVLLDTARKITDAGVERISSGILPVGSVLLSSRAPIGYLAINEVPTAINQGFIAMKCDGALANVFMLQWCHANMDLIRANANGSTFQEISRRNFSSLPLTVPAQPVLDAFQRHAAQWHRKAVANEVESETLAALRDTLLPKLISGELRVGDLSKKAIA